jgi:outer membrane protein
MSSCRFGSRVLVLVLVLALACVGRIDATQPTTDSLGELFSIAQQSEPGYRSAQANVAAAHARTRQAMGAMLPQITATWNSKGNRRRYKTLNSPPSVLHDRYHSNGDEIRLSQALWRPADVAAWRQADENAAQANAQLDDAEQQLYLKVATAWFDLMESRDTVEFSAAQRDALHAQWNITRRAAELGAQGQPQADEAQAKYEEANADEASAELDVESKLAALEQWTGSADGLLQPYLRDDAHLPELMGGDLDEWLEQIDTHSPALRAASNAIAAADAGVSQQRAGHQPTLDIVASYGDTDQAVGNFPGQTGYQIRQLAVGLQLNVPLYSGGTQSAKVTEAMAMRDKAYDELDAARRQAILKVKTAFFGWRAGKAKAAAARIKMRSAKSALAAAEKASSNGLKTDADVLAAQQEVAAARRDMRKGRYQQLTSYIQLRSTLGELSASDIDELDRMFSDKESDGSKLALATPERKPQ